MRGREHSAIVRAMKPRSGVRFAGRDKLVHLIGEGEAPLRRWWGFAERLDGTGQAVDEGFSDRNQLAAFDSAWLILPCSSDKTTKESFTGVGSAPTQLWGFGGRNFELVEHLDLLLC